MKRLFTLSFLMTLFNMGIFAQVAYVNQSASGANNGSSWTDAYTDLSEALANTLSGQVWIAKGEYKPGGATPDVNSSFVISGPIEIYGGFDGTESDLASRDWASNKAILNGDILDNDVEDDFDNNKVDNVIHVVLVDGAYSPTVIVDGLEIKGGNSIDNGNLDEIEFAGGGIFSYSTIEVNNCTFYNNYGRSGAAVYVTPTLGGGSNSIFKNNTFRNNYTNNQSAGLFLNAVSNVLVEACSFSNNSTNRGVIFPIGCVDLTIKDCHFSENEGFAEGTFGGCIFNWNSENLKIDNCNFEDNLAGFGAAVYCNGNELIGDTNNVVITNSLFKRNRAIDDGGRGGAVYFSGASAIFDNCEFDNNSCLRTGGAMHLGGDNKQVVLYNSTFENNVSSGWGGAITHYGENSVMICDSSLFQNNECTNSGGAISTGFTATTNISNSSFFGNRGSLGGALYSQNDNTSYILSNNTFFGNRAEDGSGGALYFSNGFNSEINNCLFDSNNSTERGGAMHLANFDKLVPASLKIMNSVIRSNVSQGQGGGINVQDVNTEISSCVIVKNQIETSGAGGAIIFNSTDDSAMNAKMLNNTIAENTSTIGAGIAAFTTELSSVLNLELQNNLLFNLGDNIFIEEGTPTIISNGGNMSGDMSGAGILSASNDVNNAGDPLFAGPTFLDYTLLAGSPAIGNGIDSGAPTTDIDGNPRIWGIDSGAYEYFATGFDEVEIDNSIQVNMFPNPCIESLSMNFENDWTGDIKLLIVNAIGLEIAQKTIYKQNSLLEYKLEVANLIPGAYDLIVIHKDRALTSRFVKL